MSYSWKDVAEGWCVPLRDFVGCEEAVLPAFDPFERLAREDQSFSIDQFASAALPNHPGYRVHLLKSRQAEVRMSAVLVLNGQRVGFITRKPEGCDVIALAHELCGKGLAAQLLLVTRTLRANLKIAQVEGVAQASKTLFCGGSYSVAGLATTRAAHRLAVRLALDADKPVPAEVLADYPQFKQRLYA